MTAPENQMQIDVLLPELSHLPQKTTTDELKSWIKEGKLRPTHQIRIKNLPWVEAQNIPILKPLFETKEKEDKDRLIDSYNQFSATAPAFDYLKNKAFESAKVSRKAAKSDTELSAPDEPEEASEKKEKKPVAPSIAFKLYEQKALARTQQNEPEAIAAEDFNTNAETGKKTIRETPAKSRKSVLTKRVFGYLAGCCLVFLLSYGGSYLWVYQLKTPVEINESNFPELMNLTHKLTAEKLDLRLKTAEKERELKASGGQIAPPTDISAEIVKLENQFKNRRADLIEQHRTKVQTDDLNSSFYFSFAALLSLFLITNVFVGKRVTGDGGEAFSELPKMKSPAISEASEPEEKTGISAEKDDGNGEKPENNEISGTAEIKTPSLGNVQPAKIANGVSLIGKNSASEKNETVKTAKCLLHQEKSADFNCEKCANNFCADCVVVIESEENCCPFCRTVCTRLAAETIDESPENNHNSLNLGESQESGRRIIREKRTNKVGVVPALLIALLFSCAISIFWVYKLTPYMENRGTEAARKNSNAQNNNSAATNKAQTNETGASNSNANAANEPCIDPQTRQPFECDEETRNALRDHTEKVKSVEKAQKDTAEKTDTILGLVMPDSESKPADANQGTPANPADEARKQLEKRQLVKVFSYSFLTIFGLLMAIRIFSGGRNDELEKAAETVEFTDDLA
jgi:hypothetical protein